MSENSYAAVLAAWESERLRNLAPVYYRMHAELTQRVQYAAWPLDPGPLDQQDRANSSQG